MITTIYKVIYTSKLFLCFICSALQIHQSTIVKTLITIQDTPKIFILPFSSAIPKDARLFALINKLYVYNANILRKESSFHLCMFKCVLGRESRINLSKSSKRSVCYVLLSVGWFTSK